MTLIFYRIGNFCYRHHIPILPRLMTVFGRLLFGAQIPASCVVGKNVKIAYGGAGLVIHHKAVIGDGCLLSPGVVIGGRSGHAKVPILGENVNVFPGAKILGPITIGDGANIGPNAVVIEDVEPDAVFVAPLARRVLRHGSWVE